MFPAIERKNCLSEEVICLNTSQFRLKSELAVGSEQRVRSGLFSDSRRGRGYLFFKILSATFRLYRNLKFERRRGVFEYCTVHQINVE